MEVNPLDQNGDTALHMACSLGHAETIKHLLKAGADPSMVNDQGRTPLDEAKEEGHEDYIQLLIEVRKQRGISLSLYNCDWLVLRCCTSPLHTFHHRPSASKPHQSDLIHME